MNSLPTGIYPQISSIFAHLHNFFTTWKNAGHIVQEVTLAEVTLVSNKGDGKVTNETLRSNDVLSKLPKGLHSSNARGLRESNQVKWCPDRYLITSGRSMQLARDYTLECLTKLLTRRGLPLARLDKYAFEILTIRSLFKGMDTVMWGTIKKGSHGLVPIITSVNGMHITNMPTSIGMSFIEGFSSACECNVATNIKTKTMCEYSGEGVSRPTSSGTLSGMDE